MNEKKLKALGEIQRALGMLQGLSYTTDTQVAECILDAVAIIDEALEELSECQKEICKYLRGFGNAGNLAEEIADATICLEQLRYFLGLNELVCEKMDQKIRRLDSRLRRDANG
jgi:hypothetical protein